MKTLFFYISIIVLVLFIWFILFKRRRNKKRLEKIDYSAEGKNIALSITKCKSLHKQLAKAVHPDRLTEAERQTADDLMQKINASRYDYQQLCNLKTEVETFLNKKL